MAATRLHGRQHRGKPAALLRHGNNSLFFSTPLLCYHPAVSIGQSIQRWREKRGLSATDIEQQAGLPPLSIKSIEAGQLDPTASMLASMAEVIGVPVAWLYGDPDQLEAVVLDDTDADPGRSGAPDGSVDPVTEHILRAKSVDRNLFHLLSVLIHCGEEKQLRAAEVNLRSLIKQTRGSVIPWENRQPGNFDPPND